MAGSSVAVTLSWCHRRGVSGLGELSGHSLQLSDSKGYSRVGVYLSPCQSFRLRNVSDLTIRGDCNAGSKSLWPSLRSHLLIFHTLGLSDPELLFGVAGSQRNLSA